MKEMLKFYYNLEVNEIAKKKELFEFQINQSTFLMIPYLRTEKELEEIYQVCVELKKRNIPVHTFILNKENKIITNIYNTNYILLKMDVPKDKEYNIIDILEIQNSLILTNAKNNLYRNNWSELWSKKIDYFEYQIHELGKEKKVILNSFTYYIGLAENAISYLNATTKKYQMPDNAVSLSHKRMSFPNLSQNFFNPLCFIFDLRVRDIAEYIKDSFFENETDAWIELNTFFKLKRLTPYEYQMFYARLLYPSYYFDCYEKIMNQELEEDILMKYIKKAKNFEIFLKRVYQEIIKYNPIEKIDWLIK